MLYLSRHRRRTLATLVPIICGEDAIRLGLVGRVVAQTELSIGALPPALRRAVALGLLLFEFAPLFNPALRSKRFSSMPPPSARRYYARWWTARLDPQRQFARLLKTLLALAYYDQPVVWQQLDYDPDGWIAAVAQRRLERWTPAIQRHEALLLAPDPLVPPVSRGVPDGG